MTKLLRNILLFTLITTMMLVGTIGCKSILNPSKEKPHRKERVQGAFEENLDDELNATERKAVDPIFEKEEIEHQRREKDVFGFPE